MPSTHQSHDNGAPAKPPMRNKLAIAFIATFVVWVNRNAPIFNFDLIEICACLLLLVMCVTPILLWLKDGMRTLPVFEIFCLLHFSLYVTPYLEARPQFVQYPVEVRLKCLMMVCAFLAAAYLVYYSGSSVSRNQPTRRPFFRRSLPPASQTALFWGMLIAWWLFTAAFATRLLTNSMPLVNPVRVVCLSMGVMAVFHFSYSSGGRKLSFAAEALAMGIIATGIALNISGGTLVSGIFLMLIALLAFGLGSRRVPIFAAVACVALINFLHLGKHEMRARFWAPETPTLNDSEMLNPLNVYSVWIEASWERLFAELTEDEEKNSIFKRANLLWVLAIVASETPEQRPFLMGETYAQIPVLFVPRYFYREKPRGSLPTETLGMHYGLQTDESVNFTSISFGPICEAWANFGWFGILGVGVLYGGVCLMGYRLAVGQGTTKVGFLLAIVLTGQLVDLENALGTNLVATTQAVCVAAVMLLIISKPASTVEQEAGAFDREPLDRKLGEGGSRQGVGAGQT